MSPKMVRRLMEGAAFAVAVFLGYYQWLHPNRVVQRFPWYPLAGPVLVLLGSIFFEVVAWVLERSYSKQNGRKEG
ncbi:MAG: hypothetical protein ACYC5Y_16090 [Symbiobacteriia bacterium]